MSGFSAASGFGPARIAIPGQGSGVDFPCGPLPTWLDKNLTPASTSGDGADSGIAISDTPHGYVKVYVNGVFYDLGNGVKTSDCYFSSDFGATAKPIGNIVSGDRLFWNGTLAGFDLSDLMRVDLAYLVGYLCGNCATSDDKNLTPNATTGDGQDTGLALTKTPDIGTLEVYVNGISYQIGDGVKTKDCYFSTDGGATALALSAIGIGAELWWNGIIAGFDLNTSMRVDMCYTTPCTPPVQTTDDRGLVPMVTSGNFSSTGLAISHTPTGYVAIFVNGVMYNVVTGFDRLQGDCYFSRDSGVTAVPVEAVQAGDVLYWNGIYSGIDLNGSMRLDMFYYVE